MKQTKLKKVIKWLNKRVAKTFTRKQFVKEFGEMCAETTYLCYAMNALYVHRYARGKYEVNCSIPLSMTEPKLRFEAYGRKI